jgi:aspartyl/glutamyl-tRNA(Asn/Gln) amidotransferase C subunit
MAALDEHTESMDHLVEKLDQVLEFIRMLSEIQCRLKDTHITEDTRTAALAQDDIRSGMKTAEVLCLAPRHVNGFLVVPNVLIDSQEDDR